MTIDIKLSGINTFNTNNIHKKFSKDDESEITIPLVETSLQSLSIGEFKKIDEIETKEATKESNEYEDVPVNLKNTNIYLDGEEEIRRRIDEENSKFDPNSILLCINPNVKGMPTDKLSPSEIREQYEKEHPEYKAVKDKFKDIEEQASSYIDSRVSQLMQENGIKMVASPLETIGVDIARQKAIKKFTAQAMEEYRQTHPDYDYLQARKEAREK